jgi:hypothetical protein
MRSETRCVTVPSPAGFNLAWFVRVGIGIHASQARRILGGQRTTTAATGALARMPGAVPSPPSRAGGKCAGKAL